MLSVFVATPLLSMLLGTVGTASASAILQRASFNTTCACGFKDSAGNLWREAVFSNFVSKDAVAVANEDWAVQTWGVQRGQYYMQNTAANVYNYNGALGMKTSAYTGNNKTMTAELYLSRTDILYGSFRMLAQIPTTPGTVFGFFTYESDTQETDIEFRTVDSNPKHTVHYANQPAGDVGANATIRLSNDLTQYNIHRFDWLPSATSFYFNGAKQHQITVNVPTEASTLVLNVWSDGGNWSDGPPKADAIATIAAVEAFFNSTSYSEAQFKAACASVKAKVCKVL